MPPRVFIGKSYNDGWFGLGLVLTALLVGGGVAVLLSAKAGNGDEIAATLLIVGAWVGVLTLLRWRQIARNRRWLGPTADGFVLTDRRGEFEFADEMVSDLATWAKPVYKNGVAKKMRRTGSFVITAGDAAVTFAFDYTFPLNTPDPLGAMLERVFHKLADRVGQSLDAGESLYGDGWTLTADALTIGARGEVVLPLTEVAAAEVADGKVGVWAVGESHPLLSVPGGSANALVMARVVQARMPPGAADAEPADGFGRVVFERDKSLGAAGMTARVVGGGLMLLIGLGLIVSGVVGGRVKFAPIIFGIGFVVGGGGMIAYGWKNRVNVFRCHVGGVSHTGSRGTRRLRYKDVGSFTYGGTRQYVNGAYTGTMVTMRFDPLTADAGDPLDYSAVFKNADEELDNLREFVSKVVAGHMLTRLKAGQLVPWTANMTFQPDGLVVRPTGWRKGGREPEVIEYSRLANYELNDGVFRLAKDGEKKWVVQEKVSQPNFFPGFVLLMTVLSQQSPTGPTPEDE